MKRLMSGIAIVGLVVALAVGCEQKSKVSTEKTVKTPEGSTTVETEKTIKHSGDNPPPVSATERPQ
jgi:hypothetical protein